MATNLFKYETEHGNEGGDQVTIPEAVDHNALVDRINAIAAQVGGGVALLPALPHIQIPQP